MIRLVVCICLLFSVYKVFSQENTAAVKYREGKKINFESLLIEGEKRKAAQATVTGNLGEDDFGLLKVKKDFIDKMELSNSQEVSL